MDRSEQKILQRHLARFIANDVFNTVTEEDVLKQLPGGWSLKGQTLTKGQIDLLKKEALSFSKMSLAELLPAELRYEAKKALSRAKTEEDLIAVRLLEYFIELLFSKIKQLEIL